MFDEIIPGNYFITKSMEWMRLTKTINGEKIKLGNFWFLKKFITYYNFIFSKKMDVETSDVYNEIQNSFEKFIDSLPTDQHDDAEKYFFEIDIRKKDCFFRWRDYYDASKQPEDRKKAYAYKMNAKKIYFVYLMQIGGQSGDKREILQKDLPNKVPYHELINKYSNQILNDVHAIVRNMRQVLYYYGILFRFDTKSVEDYSLTSIGELIANSTCHELSLLMEHQKIKMVSQPPTIEIKNVDQEGYEHFAIDLNPYYKILNFIKDNGSINTEEYQYVVSRNVDNSADLEGLRSKISQFSRRGDKKTEDFNKELKKYLYGLCDSATPNMNLLRFGTNPITFFKKDGVKLDEYILFISSYKDYKIKCFKNDKKVFEDILKRYYTGENRKKRVTVSELFSWLWYISTPQEDLIKSMLVFFEQENNNFISIQKKYPQIFQLFDISKKTWEKLKKIQETCPDVSQLYNSISALKTTDSDNEFEYEYITVTFQKQHISELIQKSNQSFDRLQARQRKHISYIKSYYELLEVKKCDCCGETTFKKQNGKYYLEYHHLIPISQNGPDHVLNLFGICANCHRKFHFENDKDRKVNYCNIDTNNFLKLQGYDKSSIYDRMKQLFFEDKVDLLALNYLVKEQVFDETVIEEFILQKN